MACMGGDYLQTMTASSIPMSIDQQTNKLGFIKKNQ